MNEEKKAVQCDQSAESNESKRRDKSAASAEPVQISAKTYFKDMQNFMRDCVDDKRLTPNTQLVYRTLSDLANRAYWRAEFVATDSDLMNITHIKSKNALNACKNRLKELGYIEFYGKPNRYTIYSPMDWKVGQEVDDRGLPPHPPNINTNIQPNKRGEENGRNRRSDSAGDEELRERIDSKLKRLRALTEA